jgi:hypothetical protein
VLTSDYASTAVALLSENGTLLTEAWLDSGTVVTDVGAALSGDVALPTVPTGGNTVTLIDRLGVDVITRIDVGSGASTQVSTQRGGAGGYRANPQDVLVLASGHLLVSRFEPNSLPEADELDHGNDLVVIDPERGTIDARVDFGPFDVERDGIHYFARPARIAPIGESHAVVGMARLSRSFMDAGPGAVALVDLDDRTATLVSLDTGANCGQVAPAPSAPDVVHALCAGPTFTDERGRRSSAAVVALALEGETVTVRATYRAADHPDDPAPDGGLVPLDASRLLAVASGDRTTGVPDRLVAIDLDTGRSTIVLEGSPFTLGQGVLDPVRGTIYLPDAGDGVRVLDADTLSQRAVVDTSPCRELGARAVGLVR